MVGESFPPVVPFGEPVGLDHGPHGTVQQHNALLQQCPELVQSGVPLFVFRALENHRLLSPYRRAYRLEHIPCEVWRTGRRHYVGAPPIRGRASTSSFWATSTPYFGASSGAGWRGFHERAW